MKKIKFEEIFASVVAYTIILHVVLAVILTCAYSGAANKKQTPSLEHEIKIKERVDTLTDWQIMIMAMVGVESEYNAKITNNGASGYLQITPIYVKEVNNLTDNKYEFDIEHTFNPYRTFHMFEIMNNYHNTERDIDKAIKLHNPGGGEQYKNKVKKRMAQIKAYEKTRKELLDAYKEFNDGKVI